MASNFRERRIPADVIWLDIHYLDNYKPGGAGSTSRCWTSAWPLFLEFPADAETYGLGDQFLFGRDLLVAPVLREGASAREVYLPRGDWYDYWTGRRFEGARRIRLPVTLESIPMFVREGGFLFRQPPIEHTGEMAAAPLTVAVYPAPRSEARLYEDDGSSLDYRRGAFAGRRFAQRRDGAGCVVEAGAVEGSWRPAPRDLVLRIRRDGEPRRVLLDQEPLARLGPTPAPGTAGWRLAEEGFVEVRLRDRVGAFSVSLD
jgi:hypothetical protein